MPLFNKPGLLTMKNESFKIKNIIWHDPEIDMVSLMDLNSALVRMSGKNHDISQNNLIKLKCIYNRLGVESTFI